MKSMIGKHIITMIIVAAIVAPIFSAVAQTASSVVDISLPIDIVSEIGSRVSIPITVSDVSGKGILGYKIIVRYDSSLLRIFSASAESTLSQSMQVATSSKSGSFTIAAFGNALSGSGTLIALRGEVLGSGTISLNMHFALFNEGDPPARARNGSIIAQSRSVSDASPSRATDDSSYFQQLVAQLQAQITELQTRMHALREQGGGSVGEERVRVTSVPMGAVSCPDISRDLFLEYQGNDVAQLQQFLRESGYFAYPTNTGYFGPSTERAVQLFQSAQGIVFSGEPETTGFGVVGKQTRDAIARACGVAAPVSASPFVPSSQSPPLTQEPLSFPSDAAIPPPLLSPLTAGFSLETWNGTWNNENSATDFNTRLAIAVVGTNFVLHPWSSCCDWGERTVAQTNAIANNTLSFDWSESNKTIRYTLTLLSTTRLHAVSKTSYTDGRPGYTRDEYFTKSVAAAPRSEAGLASTLSAIQAILQRLSAYLAQ